MRTATAVFWVCLLGCSSGSAELVIDLRTDFVAGVEFDRARVQVGAERLEVAFDPSVRSRLAHRVAELDVSPGDYAVEVALVAPGGETLVVRDVSVSVRSDLAVTLVITRACENVTCGLGESCLGGECVPGACIRGDEPSCPEPQCTVDTDCMGAAADCAEPRCEFGVCVLAPTGTCETAAYCDPNFGCTILPGTDAGPMDAGADAGSDAGVDAGIVCRPTIDCAIDCSDFDAWPADWAAEEMRALDEMNRFRTEGALCEGVDLPPRAPVVMDRAIRISARCHAQDMAENGFFNDIGTDGRSSITRFRDTGFDGLRDRELSSQSRREGAEWIQHMMGLVHCGAVMSEDATHIGIGRYNVEGDDVILWNAPMGKPRP